MFVISKRKNHEEHNMKHGAPPRVSKEVFSPFEKILEGNH